MVDNNLSSKKKNKKKKKKGKVSKANESEVLDDT